MRGLEGRAQRVSPKKPPRRGEWGPVCSTCPALPVASVTGWHACKGQGRAPHGSGTGAPGSSGLRATLCAAPLWPWCLAAPPAAPLVRCQLLFCSVSFTQPCPCLSQSCVGWPPPGFPWSLLPLLAQGLGGGAAGVSRTLLSPGGMGAGTAAGASSGQVRQVASSFGLSALASGGAGGTRLAALMLRGRALCGGRDRAQCPQGLGPCPQAPAPPPRVTALASGGHVQ